VRRGETLTRIAQTQFGHAAYWSCIARANPTIRDANRIYQGQLLSLPATCGP
ncbi:MAG: peptidoglycan-binding protein LysM, partial [Acidobacteria bacterium]